MSQSTDAPGAGASEGYGEVPLLASKVVLPELPAAPILRPRLLELLSRGLDGGLTLICAPAGFGKTVLLRSWTSAARPSGPVAWLSLEADDNDPARFWAYVLAALERSGALPGGIAGVPGAPGADVQLAPLLNALEGLQAPAVLVLDDFHEIGDEAILRGVQFLIRHCPPRLRLVIAARADPRLELHQLRTSGRLTELRVAELAFTLPEAAELLGVQGRGLRQHEVALLHAHTEGWAAGLRLAALTLRDHPDPSGFVAEFAGEDRSVADYLTGEVLARQPAAVRSMLLSTSILERLNGELADALTGRDDGQRMLAELERAGAFVVALRGHAAGPAPCNGERLDGGAAGGGVGDWRRTWYRYHQLFAELLRVELRHEAPERVPELHRRAAAWFSAQGLPAEAARHALSAGDWRLATTVVLEDWHELVLGDPVILRELLGMLPPELAGPDPELALGAAADRAGAGLSGEQRVAEARRRRLPLLVAALRLGEAWRAGDLDLVAVAALEMLALLGEGNPTDRPHDAARVFALGALAVAERCTGDFEAAEATLHEGMAVASRTGLERPLVDCTSQLALLDAARGRLRAAERSALQALDLAERQGCAKDPQTATAHLALTIVYGHWNDLPAAERHLEEAVAASADGAPAHAATLAATRAWLLQARGDLPGGLDALAEPRRKLAARRRPPYLERPLAVREAELRNASGDPAGARAALELAERPDRPSPEVAVARARLELDEGDARAASAILAPWLNGSATTPSLTLLVEAWLLDALAARNLGERERGFRSLERALHLAEREGFRLVFSGGRGLRELLGAQLDGPTAHRPLVAELLQARGPAPEAEPAGAALDEGTLIEPLSERERIVLRYLTSALSNVEIADELYVSVNTVKTHIKSIYRKLNATRRRDAVRRARELRLL
jgi:LuxR family transcriptional regulator, maltose regulon positive regulatory protein